MSELDIKAARELANAWRGRFFYDEERGDLAYIAKDCDDRQCDCEIRRNADGDQDCAESVEDIDDGLAEVAKMLALVPQLLDRVEEMDRHLSDAWAEIYRLRESHGLRDEGYADADYQAVAENIANDPRWANRKDSQRVARWALTIRNERDEARTALAQAERERDELREHIRDIETAKPGTELATVQQQRDDFAAEIRRLDRVVVSWGDGYRALEAERDKLRALCREACDLALSYVASRSAHKPEAAAADRLAAIRDELEKP